MPSFQCQYPRASVHVSCCFHCSMPLANGMLVIFPRKDERKEVTVVVKSCGFGSGWPTAHLFGGLQNIKLLRLCKKYPQKGLQQLAVRCCEPILALGEAIEHAQISSFCHCKWPNSAGDGVETWSYFWTLASIFSHWEALSISPQVNILHLNDYLNDYLITFTY